MSKNRTENPNIASGRIDSLEKDEIFVFGSNLEGKHLGGAAKAAHNRFGAQWGVGVGLTGQSHTYHENWKLTIETALRCSYETIESLSAYIDEWIVDVKDMNNSIYENYTKVPSIITEQLQNLKKLVPLDRITIKVPFIPYFNTKADVDSSIGVLKKIGFANIVQITYIERKSK